MTKTPVINPSISTVLDDFFASYKPAASATLRKRIDLVRSDLLEHLELEGPRVLTTGQLAILGTEKQFNPEGAFARTMHPSDLYYALEHYLIPAHAQSGLEQRELQLDVVAALATKLWTERLISTNSVSECCIIEFDLAMSRARALVSSAKTRERSLRS
jgi:hypothetical protein